MKGKIWIILGILLLIAAAGLALFNMNQSKTAGEEATAALEYIESEDKGSDWVYEEEEYSNIIEIPSIGVRLPVLKEYAYEKLEIAPCIYSGSIYTDDLVICGHNYRTHFGSLGNVSSGDKVYLTSSNGITFTYKVAGVEVLNPFAVEEMTESEADLTLFTCTWGGRTRLTVRCTRIRS